MNSVWKDPIQRTAQVDMQAAEGANIGKRKASEIEGELQLLDEALGRLCRTIDEMGERLAPVSLHGAASGQDAPPTPTPVMCQTAATIYFARAVVNDIADKLRNQIDALRC